MKHPEPTFQRAVLVGVAAALALLLVRHPVPAEAKRSTCSKRGGSTVLRTSSARIFRKGNDVYGCHRGPRRVFRLGTDLPPEEILAEAGVRPVRVAGPLVGYSYFLRDPRGRFFSSQSLRVRDLRDGRTLRLIDYSDPPDATVFRTVPDLEVKANGSLAWIFEYGALGPGGEVIRRYEVRTADGALGKRAQSANHVIDPGPDIAPESLTLRGSTLSWVRNGQVVSAPLR